MKKCVNGEYIEMTPEEIAELESMQVGSITEELTLEDRIVALEEELILSKILLGVDD